MTKPNKRLLVMEDSGTLARDLEARLNGLGHTVVGVADNGDAFLRMAADTTADFALLDIHVVGEMDGIQVARQLRASGGIPFIFLTGSEEGPVLERASAADPYGFILKPFKTAELQIGLRIAFHRREVEERTRRLERWFESTASQMGDGMIAVDAEGRVEFMNPAAERLTGASRSHVEGMPVERVFGAADPDCHAGLFKALDDSIRKGRGCARVTGLKLVTVRGEREFQLSVTPVHTAGDDPAGAVLILRHGAGSTREMMADELIRAQKMESAGTIAAGIAHDFNNLLCTIIGNATLCRMDAGDKPDLQQSLAEIETSARRGADLCSQMTNFTGRGQISPKEMDLADVVTAASDALHAMVPENVRLVLRTVRRRCRADVDEVLFRKLMTNLLQNAVDALADCGGRIVIEVGEVNASAKLLAKSADGASCRPGRYAYLKMRDDGPGIPALLRARIFEPFYSTRFMGRGLGLSEAIGIARSHRGTMFVESREGSGSEFWVFLPALGAAHSEEPAPVEVCRDDVAFSGRVLVVDDSETMAKIARTMLEAIGMEVLTATDGEVACELLKEPGQDIDALLCDMIMPNVTGIEVVACARRHRPRLPVVLMTGVTAGGRREVPKGLRIDGFLKKPFSPHSLQLTVRQLLARRPVTVDA